MSRQASRVDANQHLTVIALQAHGWATHLESKGTGPFDVLCADRQAPHFTWVCEVKDGRKPPSERRLTAREFRFLSSWPGPAAIVVSPSAAVAAGELCRAGQLRSGAAAARAYVEETGGVQGMPELRTARKPTATPEGVQQ